MANGLNLLGKSLLVFVVVWAGRVGPALAATATVSEAEKLFWEGQYDACEAMAAGEVARGVWNDRWPELQIRAQLAQGEYQEALQSYENGVKRFPDRLALKLLGFEAYRRTNQPQRAERELDQIYQLASRSPWKYGDASEQIALGRFFALRGEDARQILELIYDKVRKSQPTYADVYVAAGELALAKQDYAVAAEQLTAATRLRPLDPQVHYLLGEALATGDESRALASMQRALELNPRHVPTLLWQAEQQMDAEQYAQAEDTLERVLSVNLYEPMAWAYHAVIAHLQGHYTGEERLHEAAVSCWPGNYDLDHRIGWKLSQKYRFAEGAAYQTRSLAIRPDYMPAKFALAQDLMRLGRDNEGWKLAAEVQQNDQYHVVAYNLMELRRQLDRFTTLRDDHFIVRMDAKEAEVYGSRVLRLLHSAFELLTEKYDCDITQPVQVEIFPRQQDFAIRTFGIPGGSGYLGVCFGHLITANSPASRSSGTVNWESVLWHEFCHVVTLQKTNNRMPRWLSEGISVYEERQRDPSWGQTMTPTYRDWILDGKLTPVSQLSGAFLRPASAEHLQFAYYESSLVVEFLIEEYGLESVKRILADLAVGMPIQESLQRYTGAPRELDSRFEAYARQLAEQLGNGLEWERGRLKQDATLNDALATLTSHPTNYWVAMQAAELYKEQQNWQAIVALLEPFLKKYPTDVAAGGIVSRLSEAYRALGQTGDERRVLEQWTRYDDDAVAACLRMADLEETEQNHQAVKRYLDRLLAVNPLTLQWQERVARNARALQDQAALLESLRAQISLGPLDPAVVQCDLAEVYHQTGDSQLARRHLLMSLEEAPRYRRAQRLLLEWTNANQPHDVEPESKE